MHTVYNGIVAVVALYHGCFFCYRLRIYCMPSNSSLALSQPSAVLFSILFDELIPLVVDWEAFVPIFCITLLAARWVFSIWCSKIEMNLLWYEKSFIFSDREFIYLSKLTGLKAFNPESDNIFVKVVLGRNFAHFANGMAPNRFIKPPGIFPVAKHVMASARLQTMPIGPGTKLPISTKVPSINV